MQTNLEAMVRMLRKRTKLNNDDQYLIDELNSAQDWVYNRLTVMDENILKNSDEQFTMASQTQTYDIAANVSRPDMYAVKWLGVKLSGDTQFNPVRWMDSSEDSFMSADQQTAATGHPILCESLNFGQVRFAPPLPAGAQIMVSYVYISLPFNLDTNAALTSSTYPGLPNPMYQAIVDKASAQVFMTLDDTRAQYWEGQALAKLRAALNVIDKRQWQQIPRVKGFMRKVPRRVF